MSISSMQYGKHADKEQSIAMHVPVTCHVTNDTLVTRNDVLLRVIEIQGVPYETLDGPTRDQLLVSINTLLRTISSPNVALWVHTVRRAVSHYPAGECKNVFAKQVDDQYRASIKGVDQYINTHYLTIAVKPLIHIPLWHMVITALFTGKEASGRDWSVPLASLDEVTRTVMKAFSEYSSRVLSTYEHKKTRYSRPLEFLGEIINGRRLRIPMATRDAALLLAKCQLRFGYECFERKYTSGQQFGGMLGIREYGGETWSGTLNALLHAPGELVIAQSFTFQSKESAKKAMTKQQRKMLTSGDAAESQIAEITGALDDLFSNRLAIGQHHMTVCATAASKEACSDLLAECQSLISEESGIITERLRLGLEPAFWAQIPGNHRYIRHAAPITSLNFAGLSSFHNYPTGNAVGNHWGDAVALLRTASKTPYYFNFHYPADLGNTTIIGPSGGGKTVLALFLLAQLDKLDVTRVYFDKDRGAEIGLCAMGGHYSTLKAGESTGFNPLQLPDTPQNRAFLRTWLGLLGGESSQPLDVIDKQSIEGAVDVNYNLEPSLRRLTNVVSAIPLGSAGCLHDRLMAWTAGHDKGLIFDNETDALNLDHQVMGFDVTQFLNEPELRTPILAYIFHRLNDIIDGRRICVAFDEGWKLLDDPYFTGALKNLLKVIRKQNGITLFATQEPGDVLVSSIASTLRSQVATEIFLPNRKATESDYMKGFGLTRREFDLLTTQNANSRCFLLKQGGSSAFVDFSLNNMDAVIKVLSGTTETVKLLEEIRAEVGDDPADWLPIFQEKAT